MVVAPPPKMEPTAKLANKVGVIEEKKKKKSNCIVSG